jgi:thymidylate synthase ThyX
MSNPSPGLTYAAANSNLMSAELIYDGDGITHVPNRLLPSSFPNRETALAAVDAAGQMFGTPLERLVELAGRACYDSLGKGRKSPDYHKHIIEVNHGSVWAHANVTVEIAVVPSNIAGILSLLMNRPGVWVECHPLPEWYRVRITANLRSIREWAKWGDSGHNFELARALTAAMTGIGHQVAPQIVERHCAYVGTPLTAALVEPQSDEERWVTMLLTGSRGFSHELVRHSYRTAISQRSTRYVDENESPWVMHPLEAAYRDQNPENPPFALRIDEGYKATTVPELVGQEVYAPTVTKLQEWIIGKGVDKFTARKQARGAARGYLGNALYTEVVFSASVAQWRRMIAQRACDAADAEIRSVFVKAAHELRRSRYANRFDDITLDKKSSDGLTQVATFSREED